MSQLEDILDDALADFDIGPPKGPDQDQKTKEKLPDFNAFIQMSQEDEDKYVDDLTKEFDRAFTDLLQNTPDLRPSSNSRENLEEPDELEQNIQRTVEELMSGSSKTLPAGNEFNNQGDEGMVPILEGLLGKLLSKEILDEPLQELLSLYPDWLTENKEHEQIDLYKKQCGIVRQICEIFNGPDYQKESSKVYSLLMDMQETGPPPQGIVSKMSQEIPDSVTQPPTSPENCSLM